MLTSHVPSPDGDGQQLTIRNESDTRNLTGVLTGKRDITLICTSVPPLEYADTVVEREGLCRILEGNDFGTLGGSELVRVGVIFELKSIAAKVGRGRAERQFNVGDGLVRDIKNHIALELHRLHATITKDNEVNLLLDYNVNTAIWSVTVK